MLKKVIFHVLVHHRSPMESKAARFIGPPFRGRWLLLPLVACAGDVAFTLLGQPPAYWAGDRSAVLEFNPAARWLLLLHPAAFVAAAVVSSAIVAMVVLRASAGLACGVSLLVTIGHSIAVAAWLARMGPAGWAAAVGLLLVVNLALPKKAPVVPNKR